jgi:hypothetical protein
MAWITPKLDWTISNFINFDDFNRIENNILELYTYLQSIQYTVPLPSATNTTRTVSSIDYLSSINRIENNLDAIRLAFINPIGYLGKKTWTVEMNFDYMDANRLEGNTNTLLSLGVLVYQSFRYCGTFSCGESGGLE